MRENEDIEDFEVMVALLCSYEIFMCLLIEEVKNES